MKYLKTFEEFVNEKYSADDWETRHKEYEKRKGEWEKDMRKVLDGNMLGGLKVTLINPKDSDYDIPGMIEFKVNVDELQLDWLLTYDELGNGKPEVRVQISSPNKRGFFEKKTTGKNASAKGVWDLVTNIYNGKYKR